MFIRTKWKSIKLFRLFSQSSIANLDVVPSSLILMAAQNKLSSRQIRCAPSSSTNKHKYVCYIIAEPRFTFTMLASLPKCPVCGFRLTAIAVNFRSSLRCDLKTLRRNVKSPPRNSVLTGKRTQGNVNDIHRASYRELGRIANVIRYAPYISNFPASSWFYLICYYIPIVHFCIVFWRTMQISIFTPNVRSLTARIVNIAIFTVTFQRTVVGNKSWMWLETMISRTALIQR